jgi:rhodanese-related sulfurtransferase
MMSTQNVSVPRFQRIDVGELKRRLASESPPLVLDVRRGAAFEEHPGIPGAIPFALDLDPVRVPDVDREQPIAVYCL